MRRNTNRLPTVLHLSFFENLLKTASEKFAFFASTFHCNKIKVGSRTHDQFPLSNAAESHCLFVSLRDVVSR